MKKLNIGYVKVVVLGLLGGTILTITGCNKEGEGGTGTIEGKLYRVNHNDDNYSFTADTVIGAKEDVYIVYGNDIVPGDDTETGEDGMYRFQFLTPGLYTVYAYSELASGEKVAESRQIELKRGKTVNVEDLFIHRGKAFGTSMIRGQVWAQWFDKNGTIGTSEAYEQRVYLMRLGENYHIKDARVGYNGYYYFQKLEPDTYVICTYGETSDEIPVPYYDTVTVERVDTIYDAKPLTIPLKA